MILNYPVQYLALLFAFIVLGASAVGQSSDTIGSKASRLLPDSVALLAELPSPSRLVRQVLDHPLRSRIESMPVYQAAWRAEGLTQLKAGVSIFEASMGKRWPQVVDELTAGGVCFAFDAKTEGLAIIIQARNTAIIGELRDSIFSFLRGNKPAGAADDPIRVGEYRGITGYAIRDNLRAAVLGNLLLITNKVQLGKSIIDRYLGLENGSLAEAEHFKQAFTNRPAEYSGWGFVDVKMIRDSGEARELYTGRTNNFIAELLVGGIMSNLKSTPYATATLAAATEGLSLQVAVPHELDWVGEDRSYYFGAEGNAQAPELLRLDHQLFALSTYRDMSQAWLRAGDLMTEKANDELARADSQLTTFFSGRDFGEDILGSLEPEIQLVAVQQDFENVLPRPAIKLPAFAFQFQMRDQEETQSELRRVFQSFIGFLNVVGAMEGNPQFDLGMETSEQAQIVSATYVASKDNRGATDAAINYNFSPTVAFAGKQLIISSTTQLAKTLLEPLVIGSGRATGEDRATTAGSDTGKAQSVTSEGQRGNTVAELRAATLTAILADNRGQLVAQNMLEKGHSQEEAEGEIGVLLGLLSLLEQARLELNASSSRLALNVSLELIQPE